MKLSVKTRSSEVWAGTGERQKFDATSRSDGHTVWPWHARQSRGGCFCSWPTAGARATITARFVILEEELLQTSAWLR